ncbi:MAG: biopolymer transporter ExbD [Deltaproteobacteria bacterium]
MAVRSRTKDRKSRHVEAALTLTSMMDMFTIILLFLLKSFSSEGEIMTVDKSLRLPVSISTQTPKQRFIIQISTNDIIAEGEAVAVVEDEIKKTEYVIAPLLEALNKNTERLAFIAQNNPNIKFSGEVIVQGDKSIPFALLKKVMYTCGQAGYNGISLAVISSE